MAIKKKYYSWQDLEDQVQDLVYQLYKCPWKPDYIVGLTRGGLTPATILSNRLDIPMYALDVRLRDTTEGYTAESNKSMAQDALGYDDRSDGIKWNSEKQKNILIVDDINDSGATFEWIKQDWQNNCEPRNERWKHVWHQNVKFAVLTNNLGSTQDVDFYVDEVNKTEKPVWLVYPWE